jgi:hypothetical protein
MTLEERLAEIEPYVWRTFIGVTGIGISEKITKGRRTGRMVVTVYVRLKLSPQNIPSGQRIDEDLAVLGAVGGKRELDIKTLDRMSIPEPEPQIEDRIRPVATGLSEGHFKVTAGTGSVLLLYTPDSAIAPTAPLPPYRVRLSNNHVYAIQNEAELQDPIFQPGPHDGGTNNDTVGRLLKYVPIHFDGVTPNEVDACTAWQDPRSR